MDFVNMALKALFQDLSDKELVDQFNAKAEEGNDNECAEIIRRNLRVKMDNDKLIMI